MDTPVYYYDPSTATVVYGIPPPGAQIVADPNSGYLLGRDGEVTYGTEGAANSPLADTGELPIQGDPTMGGGMLGDTTVASGTPPPQQPVDGYVLGIGASVGADPGGYYSDEAPATTVADIGYDTATGPLTMIDPATNDVISLPVSYTPPPDPAYGGDGSYGGGSGYGGGYSRGGYSRGGGGSYGYGQGGGYGSDSSGRTVPRYADGSVHPYFGGEQRRPGGFWNDGSSSYPKTASQGYPGEGASAGQWGARAPGPAAGYSGGGEVVGGSGGGGGGSAAYWAFRNQIMGRIGGALGGATTSGDATNAGATDSSGGSSSGSSGSGGSGKGGAGAGETGLKDLRGWAGRQKYTPLQLAENVYEHPEYLYPDVVKGLKTTDPLYSTLDSALTPHLGNLWSLTAGSQRGNMGAPDQYANWLNRTIDDTLTPGGGWFRQNQLLRGLFNPDRKSSGWMAQQGGTPAEQLYALQSQLSTIGQLTMAPSAATAWGNYVEATANRYGNRLLHSGKKGKDPYAYLKKRLY